MAVASKSAVSARRRPNQSKAKAVALHKPKVKPLPRQVKDLTNRLGQSVKTVPILPSFRSAPFWLRHLCTLQRYSTVVTFLLVAATLTIYGWTVYSQQVWGQAYSKLVKLQRDERQLTTTSEVLKNQMAQQAEQPATGLVQPNPGSAIFLQPVPQRQAVEKATAVNPATNPIAQTKQPTPTPLGY